MLLGARARGFNPTSVAEFQRAYADLYSRHGYSPSNIYNMDETSISTVQSKCRKILACKGKRQVCTLLFL